jgi:hypothetical protein
MSLRFATLSNGRDSTMPIDRIVGSASGRAVLPPGEA